MARSSSLPPVDRNSSTIQDLRSSSSSSALNRSIDSLPINGPFRVGTADGNSCSYHALVAGESCRKPRTCYECLNVNVAGVPDGCLLAPSGFCEYMSSYEASLDYRRNTSAEDLRATGWYNFFPSVNATYCEPHDPACVLCTNLANGGALSPSWRAPNVSTEVARHFCTGGNSCVCVMACEAENWEVNMPTECDANGSVSGGPDASSSATNYSTMLIIYLVLQVALVAVLMHKRGYCRRMAPCSRQEGPYNNVDAIASPSNQLRLSGWKRMQKTLIENEKKHRRDLELQDKTLPQDNDARTEVDERNSTGQSLSPQLSTRNCDIAFAQVHDDSETERCCSRERDTRGVDARLDNDVVVVEGLNEDRRDGCGGTRTVRASSTVAMLEPRRNAG